MKISKYNFLKILAKHFALKLGARINTESELILLVNSSIPAFNYYVPILKRNFILNDNDEINIDLLEEKLEQTFSTIPIINLPFNGTTISITKKDIDVFLKDVKKHGIVDEVIYLPCH